MAKNFIAGPIFCGKVRINSQSFIKIVIGQCNTRITLTDNNFNERLTIDANLSAKNGTSNKIFGQLIISEIKQNKYNPKSDFIRILRNLKIQEMRFSKYCMGLLHINNNLKYNRFKPGFKAVVFKIIVDMKQTHTIFTKPHFLNF